MTLHAVLAVEDYDKHYEMVTGKTHFKRSISDKDFTKVRKIQHEFIKRAHENEWPVIYIENTIEDTVLKIKDIILK